MNKERFVNLVTVGKRSVIGVDVCHQECLAAQKSSVGMFQDLVINVIKVGVA